MSTLRRRFWAGVFALLSASLLPIPLSSAADLVSLRLDWTLSGYHLPFYWAKHKGYYTTENLNVEIKEGAGSGKTVSLIAGQQDDIGLADYMLMAAGVVKGMKLKGVYAVVQNGAWAVISLADNPITKPQDLIGRSVAVTADHKALLDLLLAVNKIPPEKVSIRVTSPATRNTVFVNGQVDTWSSAPVKAKANRCTSCSSRISASLPSGRALSSTSKRLRRSPTLWPVSYGRRRAG